MPFFSIEDTTDIDGFVGVALTIGWIAEVKTFQIALTIGNFTIAFGIDFDF